MVAISFEKLMHIIKLQYDAHFSILFVICLAAKSEPSLELQDVLQQRFSCGATMVLALKRPANP